MDIHSIQNIVTEGPAQTVTLGWALHRFMNDVKSGRIKFELEI